jgi:Helix-loop-helix DNA-binding domain
MQQALQSFQANADALSIKFDGRTSTPTANLALQQPLENQQQMQALQHPPQFAAGVAPAAQLPVALQQSSDMQQQLLWQQALQTLSVVPPFAPAPNQTPMNSTAPFLALLTMPHLMQHNLQQAAIQQQQQQQQYPAVPTFDSHSLQLSTTTNNAAFKRSGSSNASNDGAPSEPNRKRSRNQDKPSGKSNSSSTLQGGPSVVSLTDSRTSNPAQPIDGMDNLQPPTEKSAADVAKMTAAERRRYERNFREQQRSYRISQQIKELRDVLEASNVPFRPNKYSILVNVAEYIQQLQSRAIMLDSEHQRLIKTIRSTTEVMEGKSTSNEGTSLTSNSDGEDDCAALTPESDSFNEKIFPEAALLVQGIDYEAVFKHCPYPLGLASLDGSVLASNDEFERFLNPDYGKTSMKNQSFFIYIRNHQDIFEAMSALLKQSTPTIVPGQEDARPQQLLFWRGQVLTSRNEMVRCWTATGDNFQTSILLTTCPPICDSQVPVTMTLTNTADNNPGYFCISVSLLS